MTAQPSASLATSGHSRFASWVGTWATAPQPIQPGDRPPAPGLTGNTLRQVISASIGGQRLRIQLSNAYGSSELTLTQARVARAGVRDAIEPPRGVALTFGGAPSLTIPAGEARFSDPFEFPLAPGGRLSLSIQFGHVPEVVTGHAGSRTTSYLRAGDATSAPSLPGASTTDHWYFLAALDVLKTAPARAIVTLGDSLTDGRGSTTDGNDRWPDLLARRLRERESTRDVAVLNMGIGGNALSQGGLGATARERFERDVLEQRGVCWVILLAGVNDIAARDCTRVADELIATYQELVDAAHARGILVAGVPLLPFGGSEYDRPWRELARQVVGDWIRASGSFDTVFDLELAVRDPIHPTALQHRYDGGDHLHLNPAGYAAMADAIDLDVFTR